MTDQHQYLELLQSFHSGKFDSLRPAQDYVLQQYAGFAEIKDVAIELPTGAGKSLIALLIGETWRRQDKKVAVLSANKVLARQMVAEAEELGIPVVLMEGGKDDISVAQKRSYHRSRAIAVMNYWVYFNQNPAIDNADLLIMDDAHLAEQCLHSLYSVEISRFSHKELFEQITNELRTHYPEYRVLHEAVEGGDSAASPPELLSFIDQIAYSPRLTELVDSSPLLVSDKDLYFRWGRMRGSVNEANIYMSTNTLWIRPYIYPLISNPYYENVTQRIYMSATIGDPNDLCRRLGTRKITTIPVPTEFGDATVGRRMVLFSDDPCTADGSLSPELVESLLPALSRSPKSVWLCPSKSAAEKIRTSFGKWITQNGFGNPPSWILSTLGEELDAFRNAAAGHLFVGGRFDGMDFHGDECRLVVLAALPKAINVQEEFLSAYLRDASFMRRRLNQRIAQAFGRCNRSPEDYAVYILADKRFAAYLGKESNRQSLTRHMMAEIDLAENCTEFSTAQLNDEIRGFLNADFTNYDPLFRDLLADVPMANAATQSQTTNKDDETAPDEVVAWTALFQSKNYDTAASYFNTCWNSALERNIVELGAFYGWCLAKAMYLKALQGSCTMSLALDTLEKALSRGGASAWFNRRKTSLNRAKNQPIIQVTASETFVDFVFRAFDQQLEKFGGKGRKFEQWCARLSEMLSSDSHNAYLEGLCELGELIGFDTTRPSHNAATDCRWRGSFSDAKIVITIEGKIEHVISNTIVPHDVGQAHNQLQRAKAEYEYLGYNVRGVIITHLDTIDASAQSSLGPIRIIQKAAILALWNRTYNLLVEYRMNWHLDDLGIRKVGADRIRGKIPDSNWLQRAIDIDQQVITPEILLREWGG